MADDTGTEQPQNEATEEGSSSPPSPPDVSEQVAALTQEFQSFRDQVIPPSPQGADLYDNLAGQPPVQGPPQYQEPGYAPPQPQQPQGQPQQGYDPYAADPYGDPYGDPYMQQGQPPQAAPLDEQVRERVAEYMGPALQQMEEDRRRGQINQLAERFPEIKNQDVQDAIADRLGPMADRYGNPMLMTDPDLIEAVLIAERTTRESAGEVPAEQGANQGAPLETRSGAAAPEAEESPEDQIRQGILNAAGKRDLFTS